MKRGRTLLLLLLLLILGAGAALLILQPGIFGLGDSGATPTPEVRYVAVYVAGQQIPRASLITEELLTTIQNPEDQLTESMIQDPALIIGKMAKYPIEQGIMITNSMLADSILQVAQTGSEAARLVPPGMTAISIPISRLSSVAYAIRDGDRVNLIASMLFLDLDPNTQSSLPNKTGGVTFNPAAFMLTAVIGDAGTYGRVELDPALQFPVYIQPSEAQRPRMVSHMIMQDIQVLHVGTFLLPDEEVPVQPIDLAATATPVPVQNNGETVSSIERPDIITLVVTPQDAVTLTYLISNGTQLTLTLRGADDTSRVETEAATLQFLLSQYGIPVPAKLPYGTEPRIDSFPNFVPMFPEPGPSPTPAQ